jgi:DNA-binding XRE family transcriptional regulator
MNAEIQTIILKGLDRQLPAMQQAHLGLEVPSKGWLRAVRGALGLTQRKVAAKLRMKQQPYAAIEEREMSGTVTLETLRRAAGCRSLLRGVGDETQSGAGESPRHGAFHGVGRAGRAQVATI